MDKQIYTYINTPAEYFDILCAWYCSTLVKKFKFHLQILIYYLCAHMLTHTNTSCCFNYFEALFPTICLSHSHGYLEQVML